MEVGRLCHGPDGEITSVTAINPHTTEEHEHHVHRRWLAAGENRWLAAGGGHYEEGSFEGEYCEPICEPEPDKEIEIAEGFAMAVFTVDYLLRLLTVHAVPYRLLNPEGYAKNRDVSCRHPPIVLPSPWSHPSLYICIH